MLINSAITEGPEQKMHFVILDKTMHQTEAAVFCDLQGAVANIEYPKALSDLGQCIQIVYDGAFWLGPCDEFGKINQVIEDFRVSIVYR